MEDILPKKKKRKKKKKRERERKRKKKKMFDIILKKLRSYFLHDLLSFCVLGIGKRAFSKGDLLAPPT